MNATFKINLTVKEKISLLRQTMAQNEVDAYVVANSDPHNSEYPAPHWMGREWLSGFCGSNGTIVLTADKAGLWTDSRYYLLAEKALVDTGIELFRMNDEGVPTQIEWICKELHKGQNLGVYEETISRSSYSDWENKCRIAGISIIPTEEFLNKVWLDRPPIPAEKSYKFPLKFAGSSRKEKVAQLRTKMKERSADWHVITRLEEICWLLNIRGRDVEGQTTLLAYILVSQNKLYLLVNNEKISLELQKELKEDSVILKGYNELSAILTSIPEDKTVLINPDFINQYIYSQLQRNIVIEGRDIITDLKAIKNSVEIEHLKKCLAQDATALVKFQIWLEEEYKNQHVLSEYILSQKLYELRSELPGYLHSSFPNIVGYNGNGALNHYFVTKEIDTPIDGEGLVIVDSGGSYYSGTTDTTRVFNFGKPNRQQKEDYTAVLKSLINLSMTVFAQGTTGAGLDGICRQPMWKMFKNFKHGTGHGVGFSLYVHEGPQNINRSSTEEVKAGMITTIEPGIYRPGLHGIRIENITLCRTVHENEFGKFLSFETLTRAPINTELIETSLINDDERQWLNSFHEKVYEDLSPLLNSNQNIWLKKKCAAI